MPKHPNASITEFTDATCIIPAIVLDETASDIARSLAHNTKIRTCVYDYLTSNVALLLAEEETLRRYATMPEFKARMLAEDPRDYYRTFMTEFATGLISAKFPELFPPTTTETRQS